jgi:hypothetical protein
MNGDDACDDTQQGACLRPWDHSKRALCPSPARRAVSGVSGGIMGRPESDTLRQPLGHVPASVPRTGTWG